MLSEFIISFRESLEAILAVAIILLYLHKTGNWKHSKIVFAGVLGGLAVSLVLAFGITNVFGEVWKANEPIFEGSLMIIAVAMITWFIVWAFWHLYSKGEIEGRAKSLLARKETIGLGIFSFVSVAREGFELVLLTFASAAASSGDWSLLWILLGIASAALLVGAIFILSKNSDIRPFFLATSVILVLFASGLLSHAVHEFDEAGLLDSGPVLWDTSGFLENSSPVGSILRSLVGYTARPTMLEAVSYLAYCAFGIHYIAKKAKAQNRV
ncbi:hypothetical protein FJZ26_04265 [Candidatus Parvarchaeota archaeon]|nr:hypothetical protein [Candidatus Parvarchaeota archaeon]